MNTMTENTLLKAKQEAKRKRPLFKRTDAHKKKRLNKGWHKPKGIQNKMRLAKKGYRVTVKPGYGTPAALRGADRKGLKIVRVETLAQLEKLDPKTQAAELAAVGRKRKEELLAAASKKNITIVNLRVKAYQEKTKAIAQAKATEKKKAEEAAKAKAARQAKAAKDAEKKAAEESKKEEPQDEEAAKEQKEQERKEQEKVLTSKKGL